MISSEATPFVELSLLLIYSMLSVTASDITYFGRDKSTTPVRCGIVAVYGSGALGVVSGGKA